MNKVIALLDLDNTLLKNDADVFIPVYIKSLGAHLSDLPAGKVIQELMTGTQRMIQKKFPDKTLEEVFNESFYPGIGIEKAVLESRITEFYDLVYPRLKSLTAGRPEAVQLITALSSNRSEIIIATNPLFPRTAIVQRVRWAGIDPDAEKIRLIPSFETMHFAKPNPAYFAELLALTGWPDSPAVMVGDSLAEDILPASQLGLPAYWVTDSADSLPANLHPLSTKGKIEDVLPWIEKIAKKSPELQFNHPASALAVLSATPAALSTALKSVDVAHWNKKYSSEEWSLVEILCHLRDVDQEVNIPRFERILARENPFLPGIVTDIWAEERNYNCEEGSPAFTSFLRARTNLLSMLYSQDEEGWKLPARHAIFGPTHLKELVSFIATHDRTHIQQVWKTIRLLNG